uniref:Uncharacterized protein n=1 Tax=Arundo donax TaxID=35708 RepID=A0A0A8YJ70_ARUDO
MSGGYGVLVSLSPLSHDGWKLCIPCGESVQPL